MAETGKRRISILGSTGSIGVNTLDVVNQLGGREAFEVVAITGNSNIALLADQAKACGAKLAVTADDRRYATLKDALSGSGIEVAAGREALIEAGARPSDWVMA
ncbi:1-deoxy-D-xylulose-5-phosphate reductoisomerase, partial [Neorhizobium sp. SHOUNA12A]|nr:1-deoxy-D-xylulose-5-phosphate reductoisomerase [Neorhizobium sp. SHOUNA12A]